MEVIDRDVDLRHRQPGDPFTDAGSPHLHPSRSACPQPTRCRAPESTGDHKDQHRHDHVGEIAQHKVKASAPQSWSILLDVEADARKFTAKYCVLSGSRGPFIAGFAAELSRQGHKPQPLDSKPGRYRPPDALLRFLDGLWTCRRHLLRFHSRPLINPWIEF